MSKTTMGTKLPKKLEQKMQTVGEQIKLARLRRKMGHALQDLALKRRERASKK